MRRPTRPGWLALGATLLAWATWLALAHGDAQRALTAYLLAWLFVLGIPLGSLSLLLIHGLTGGGWGESLRPGWIAALRWLPCILALSLPLLLAAPMLFAWTRPGAATSWPTFYLNLPFFYLRCALCYACWFALAVGALRRLARRPLCASPGFAAAGLLLMLATVSVTAIDWIMSRVHGWHTTAIGLSLFCAQLLLALAWAIFRRLRSARRACPAELRQDLANLLLAALLGWAYLVFMDYLTAWISDLPADTVWYLPRLRTSWQWLGAALCVFGIGLPVLLLLLRGIKRHTRALAWLAATLVLTQLFYFAWLVLPETHLEGFAVQAVDPLALLCVGASIGCYVLCSRSATPPQADAR